MTQIARSGAVAAALDWQPRLTVAAALVLAIESVLFMVLS